MIWKKLTHLAPNMHVLYLRFFGSHFHHFWKNYYSNWKNYPGVRKKELSLTTFLSVFTALESSASSSRVSGLSGLSPLTVMTKTWKEKGQIQQRSADTLTHKHTNEYGAMGAMRCVCMPCESRIRKDEMWNACKKDKKRAKRAEFSNTIGTICRHINMTWWKTKCICWMCSFLVENLWEMSAEL